MKRLALLLTLLVSCSSETVPTVEWRGQQFRQVASLKDLPDSIQTVLGVGKPGLDGIADAGGSFNATDVVDTNLPMRRFVFAGLSKTHSLVVIERGGRGHNYLVGLYELPMTQQQGWVLVTREAPANLEQLVQELSHKHAG
jgi:hypothetical protein